MRSDLPIRALGRDSSWSSTISVGSPATKEINASNLLPLEQETKKIVRINESANIFHENNTVSEDDCDEAWYDAEDYSNFRENTVFMIKAITDFETIIREEEEDAETVAASYTNILESVYLQCERCEREDMEESFHLSEEKAQEFAEMYERRYNLVRIGLERHTVEPIKRGIRERRHLMQQLAQEFQEEQDSGSYWESQDQMSEAFREVCESISRPARLFARCIAQAQAQQA